MLAPTPDHALVRSRYPRSNAYDPSWVFANEIGPNALWLMEWLRAAVPLQPDLRVLDPGCGRVMTSIFLAREFGVQVWANDLWIAASDNWERIRAAGVEDRVFPIHAEAHQLPYADGFFDAILSVDSCHYHGTDDLYPGYVGRFLKPGGHLGIVIRADFIRAQVAAGATNREWTAEEGEPLMRRRLPTAPRAGAPGRRGGV